MFLRGLWSLFHHSTQSSRARSTTFIPALALASVLGASISACSSDSDGDPASAGDASGGAAAQGGSQHASGASNSSGGARAQAGAKSTAGDRADSAGSNGDSDDAGSAGEGGEGGGPAAPEMVRERALTLNLTLTLTPATDATAASSKLVITALDGDTPVVTDLWLYTLAGQVKTPLTGFTSTAPRKVPTLMLPATIKGEPSGLTPPNDGVANGVMTNITRGSLSGGSFVSAVTGTVTVTLAAIPTRPILVIAGVEDQRYAGAAVVKIDGTAGETPAGVSELETHVKRSYARDIVPLLQTNCTVLCHNIHGPEGAWMYKMDSRDDLVNDNFALTESTSDCKVKYPDGGDPLSACVAAITKAQFLVEPGAPAVSDLLQRSRPDEDAGSSANGLAWWGGGNPKARYNAEYGDRRMPSTTLDVQPSDWTNDPTTFDSDPAQFQILYDWVAQGALP